MIYADKSLMVKGVYIVLTGLGWVPPSPCLFIFKTSNVCALQEVTLFVHTFPSHSSKMEQLDDLRMLFHPERLC